MGGFSGKTNEGYLLFAKAMANRLFFVHFPLTHSQFKVQA